MSVLTSELVDVSESPLDADLSIDDVEYAQTSRCTDDSGTSFSAFNSSI